MQSAGDARHARRELFFTRGGPRAPGPVDAITWMGVCAWRKGGVWGFITFTGLSILPQTLTLGDVLSRGVAAAYLRLRSKSFRRWVGSIPGAHLATWVLRATLLSVALFTGWRLGEISGQNACIIEFLAMSLALILTAAEKERDRRLRLTNAKKEFLGIEKMTKVKMKKKTKKAKKNGTDTAFKSSSTFPPLQPQGESRGFGNDNRDDATSPRTTKKFV